MSVAYPGIDKRTKNDKATCNLFNCSNTQAFDSELCSKHAKQFEDFSSL